jgi:hypothetical protein
MDHDRSEANGYRGRFAIAFTCEICQRACTRFTSGDPTLIRRCFAPTCEDLSVRRDSDRILSQAFEYAPAVEEHA